MNTLEEAYNYGVKLAMAEILGTDSETEKTAEGYLADDSKAAIQDWSTHPAADVAAQLLPMNPGGLPVSGAALGALRGARHDDTIGGAARGAAGQMVGGVGGALGGGLGGAALGAGLGGLAGAGSAAWDNYQRSKMGPIGRFFTPKYDVGQSAANYAEHYAPVGASVGALGGALGGGAYGTRAATQRYIEPKEASVLDREKLALIPEALAQARYAFGRGPHSLEGAGLFGSGGLHPFSHPHSVKGLAGAAALGAAMAPPSGSYGQETPLTHAALGGLGAAGGMYGGQWAGGGVGKGLQYLGGLAEKSENPYLSMAGRGAHALGGVAPHIGGLAGGIAGQRAGVREADTLYNPSLGQKAWQPFRRAGESLDWTEGRPAKERASGALDAFRGK